MSVSSYLIPIISEKFFQANILTDTKHPANDKKNNNKKAKHGENLAWQQTFAARPNFPCVPSLHSFAEVLAQLVTCCSV